ncbi:MAG: NAD(P)-binding protein [Candidatus Pacebacteria bacterium]|nr:NAD(P)-binding protein [Candidatus Paceibacterota bacterium]
MEKTKKIVIIGGGPTGLGAAYRLRDLGYKNWTLYEQNSYFGGLSSTRTDNKGFLWDLGGHVLFSHFDYYDKFVKESLGKDHYRHQRESWIQYEDALVPYPFQNNIRYLSPEERLKCLSGLFEVDKKKQATAKNFKEWILHMFGEGIAEKFMFPYNFSVWATPPELMDKGWIADRVSMIDAHRALRNVILEQDDVGWGPNNTFMFPKHGGTGRIFSGGADLVKSNTVANKKVVEIDIKQKKLYFKDGSTETYNYLISAVSINNLVKIIKSVPKTVYENAQKLTSNGVMVIGIGLKRSMKTSKCWVYFPDKNVPFYRLTYFHNYSRNNVPNGDIKKYSSLMLEVAYSKYKKINKKRVIEDSIDALIRYGILDTKDRKNIISKAMYDLPQGYPVPTLGRDKLLDRVQPYLMKHGVYSRGRFGAWKYEIANMDHSFMQGVQAVDNIISGKKEEVWKEWT